MDYSFPLYDTAIFGATANVTFPLFQISEGGDATHTPDFTNMRGAGYLPAAEKYMLRNISVYAESLLTLADQTNWFINSFLKLTVANVEVFRAPMISVICEAGWGGHFTQAAAADLALIGRLGNGYDFDPVIQISNGTSFKVELFQGTATAANRRIKCVLDGILTRGN